MECPVCRGQAENLTPNTLDGVVVSCAQCGDYKIAGLAFHGFLRLQDEQRTAALQAAKLGTRGGWPTISGPPPRGRPALISSFRG